MLQKLKSLIAGFTVALAVAAASGIGLSVVSPPEAQANSFNNSDVNAQYTVGTANSFDLNAEISRAMAAEAARPTLDANNFYPAAPIRISNYAALLLTPQPSTSGLRYVTSGYYTDGDGGQATYIWNSSNTNLADGIFTVAPNFVNSNVTGATFSATVTSGTITAITITNAGTGGSTSGTGYPLSISGCHLPVASGTFNVTNGGVSSVSITNGGANCSSPVVTVGKASGGTFPAGGSPGRFLLDLSNANYITPEQAGLHGDGSNELAAVNNLFSAITARGYPQRIRETPGHTYYFSNPGGNVHMSEFVNWQGAGNYFNKTTSGGPVFTGGLKHDTSTLFTLDSGASMDRCLVTPPITAPIYANGTFLNNVVQFNDPPIDFNTMTIWWDQQQTNASTSYGVREFNAGQSEITNCALIGFNTGVYNYRSNNDNLYNLIVDDNWGVDIGQGVTDKTSVIGIAANNWYGSAISNQQGVIGCSPAAESGSTQGTNYQVGDILAVYPTRNGPAGTLLSGERPALCQVTSLNNAVSGYGTPATYARLNTGVFIPPPFAIPINPVATNFVSGTACTVAPYVDVTGSLTGTFGTILTAAPTQATGSGITKGAGCTVGAVYSLVRANYPLNSNETAATITITSITNDGNATPVTWSVTTAGTYYAPNQPPVSPANSVNIYYLTGTPTIASGGSGYKQNDYLTVTGGTCDYPPILQVTSVNVTSTILTLSVISPGICRVSPTGNANVSTLLTITGGSGTGAQIDGVFYASTGSNAQLDVSTADATYRRGSVVFAHDQCDYCLISNVNGYGFDQGVLHLHNVLTNVVAKDLTYNAGSSNLTNNPIGLMVDGCVHANINNVGIDGAFQDIRENASDPNHYSAAGTYYDTTCTKGDSFVSMNNIHLSPSGLVKTGLSGVLTPAEVYLGPYSVGNMSFVRANGSTKLSGNYAFPFIADQFVGPWRLSNITFEDALNDAPWIYFYDTMDTPKITMVDSTVQQIPIEPYVDDLGTAPMSIQTSGALPTYGTPNVGRVNTGELQFLITAPSIDVAEYRLTSISMTSPTVYNTPVNPVSTTNTSCTVAPQVDITLSLGIIVSAVPAVESGAVKGSGCTLNSTVTLVRALNQLTGTESAAILQITGLSSDGQYTPTAYTVVSSGTYLLYGGQNYVANTDMYDTDGLGLELRLTGTSNGAATTATIEHTAFWPPPGISWANAGPPPTYIPVRSDKGNGAVWTATWSLIGPLAMTPNGAGITIAGGIHDTTGQGILLDGSTIRLNGLLSASQGVVDDISVTSPGLYNKPAVVTIAASTSQNSPVQALALARMSLVSTGITIVSGGSGFSVNQPLLLKNPNTNNLFTCPNGLRPYVHVGSISTGGAIASVVIANGGQCYDYPDNTQATNNYVLAYQSSLQGTPAQIQFNYAVVGVDVTTPGGPYLTPPALSISASVLSGGSNAAIQSVNGSASGVADIDLYPQLYVSPPGDSYSTTDQNIVTAGWVNTYFLGKNNSQFSGTTGVQVPNNASDTTPSGYGWIQYNTTTNRFEFYTNVGGSTPEWLNYMRYIDFPTSSTAQIMAYSYPTPGGTTAPTLYTLGLTSPLNLTYNSGAPTLSISNNPSFSGNSGIQLPNNSNATESTPTSTYGWLTYNTSTGRIDTYVNYKNTTAEWTQLLTFADMPTGSGVLYYTPSGTYQGFTDLVFNSSNFTLSTSGGVATLSIASSLGFSSAFLNGSTTVAPGSSGGVILFPGINNGTFGITNGTLSGVTGGSLTAAITSGAVSSITITAAGSGGLAGTYPIYFSGGSCTTTASGTYTVASGVISATSITAGGAGCTSAPTASIVVTQRGILLEGDAGSDPITLGSSGCAVSTSCDIAQGAPQLQYHPTNAAPTSSNYTIADTYFVYNNFVRKSIPTANGTFTITPSSAASSITLNGIGTNGVKNVMTYPGTGSNNTSTSGESQSNTYIMLGGSYISANASGADGSIPANASATARLTIDGLAAAGANCILVPAFWLVAMDIDIIGLDHTTSGIWARYHTTNFSLFRSGTAASTLTATNSISAAAPNSGSAGVGSSATFSISADTSNACLNITVVSPNTDSWQWTARVYTTEAF